MLRRLHAFVLVALIVAWAASPCFGLPLSADQNASSCPGMTEGQPMRSTMICCAMDDAGRRGLPEASVATPSTPTFTVLTGLSFLPALLGRTTVEDGFGSTPKLDLSPFPTLHVPLRI
jgi:hypothetical protein